MRLRGSWASLAAVLAIGLLASTPAVLPQSSTVRAAGGLVTVADATYTVLPDGGGVRVVINIVATSNEPDTPDAQVYYTGMSFAVPAAAASFTASSGSSQLGVRIQESTEDYRVIAITFSRGVFYRQSYPFRVTFDLVDAGGEAGRDVRIGRSVVAFPVWAFGTDATAGGSVTVILPPTFSPTWSGSDLTSQRQADGSTVLRASVSEPGGWFVYLIAERPGIFAATVFGLDVGGSHAVVRVRAWDDDPAWSGRIQELLTLGLPALQELIGLPWPVHGELKVEESATLRLGEYAGIYNKSTELITVRYDADALVALHEAAHAWFNQDLFRERWIGEAWAEFYGVHAAAAVGESGEVFALTDELLAVRIALNDWGDIGAEDPDVEAFAYAATYQLAELIFDRTDLGALQLVWRAANDGETAYQPLHDDGPATTGVPASQPGWQRLLDLLEERTDVAYDDLWSDWVVSAGQRALLDDRAEARERYLQVVEAAGSWELPAALRYELSSWLFGETLEQLGQAAEVITLRDEIRERATVLDIAPPDDLRIAFEGDAGFAAARSEALGALEALQAIDDAVLSLADELGPLEWIGLLLADPAADLAVSLEAWQAGDSAAAANAAAAASTTRNGAGAAGRDRLLFGGGGTIAAGGGGLLLWRRSRRPRTAAGPRAVPADRDPEDSAPGPGGQPPSP